MNPLELLAEHCEASIHYRLAKRARRRAMFYEHLWEERCRRLRNELQFIGITLLDDPNQKPKE